MKKTIAFVLCLLIGFSAFAQATTEKYDAVCSTSWIAAFAEMAGVENIKTIAPPTLQHPPEYEITAGDILAVTNAPVFIYAGYERMMNTIAESSEIDKSKQVQITTRNDYEDVESAVLKIAEKAGNMEKAKKNLEDYKKLLEVTKQQIKEKGLDKVPCLVHSMQEPLAKDLGLNIEKTFGPSPVNSDLINLASDNHFGIIIDNSHNPVAQPLAEVSPNSKLVVWDNFPSELGKNALLNMVEKNIENLIN